MSKYVPRLTAPSASDKNYIKKSSGGYNYCIEIKDGSCLPNCVGYAWGRWRELLGKYHNLSRGNAENWYGKTSDGYKRGNTPKLGAVICWRKGKAGNANDGAGHVAIVEQINVDGSIVASESSYGGKRFSTRKLKASNNYYLGSKYAFQGFIYLPIEFEVEEEKPKEEPKVETSDKTSDNDKTSDIVYTVKKGDTLIGIANKYKTTYKKLAAYNNIANPNIIHVGQKIRIPQATTTSTTTAKLKVGDKVIIVGTGKARANGGGANAGGIGFTRYITAIHTGSAYPYQVGFKGDTSSKGTTGFYKESAIKKV